jgi:hypothetical protein
LPANVDFHFKSVECLYPDQIPLHRLPKGDESQKSADKERDRESGGCTVQRNLDATPCTVATTARVSTHETTQIGSFSLQQYQRDKNYRKNYLGNP